MTRVLSIAGIVLLAVAASGAYLIFDRARGPDQPIAFYHNVHAGVNQIPCMYCHYTADQSYNAGIPSVQLCVGCHVPGSGALPPEQAQLGFPQADRNEFWSQEATKLVNYWREGRPIPWVRVHNLPKHVKFPHYMHVNVGLQCQTCHGPVERMDLVYQYSSLQMGWCIQCHRGDTELSPQEEANVQARSSFIRRIAALEAAGSDVQGQRARWPNQRASIDCFVCHY